MLLVCVPPFCRTPPPPDSPKFRSFFFPSPTTFFILPSLGGFLVEFWWCFCPPNIMCTFGLSGCCVKPRRLWGRGSFTRQPENSKREHLTSRHFQTPPKNHEKTLRERQRERKMGGGRRKKSVKFWAPHPSFPHPSAPPPFSGFGTPPSGPHHDTHQIQKLDWLNCGQNWIGLKEGGGV